MTKKQVIEKTVEFIKKEFENEGTGHDWWHIYRVWKDATAIGKKENTDLFIVELGALMHEMSDFKLFQSNLEKGILRIKSLLKSMEVESADIEKVCNVVRETSFKGAQVADKAMTIESKVVQDADRLDAIGAMGIARVFAYGGKVGRPLFDPNIKPIMHKDYEDYKKHGNNSSINHFYEKLLLLKDRMNTQEAKKVAKDRHNYMVRYLDRFMLEWEGKK